MLLDILVTALPLIDDKTTEMLIFRGFIPLIATFSGAFFAYYFQNKREEKKERLEDILSLHKTLFVLNRWYKALLEIKINPISGLDKFYKKNERGAEFNRFFYFMLPEQELDIDFSFKLSLELELLDVFLKKETFKKAKILTRLYNQQSEINKIKEVFEKRNNFLKSTIIPIKEKAKKSSTEHLFSDDYLHDVGSNPNEKYSEKTLEEHESEIVDILGENNTKKIYIMTLELYQYTYLTLATVKLLHSEIHKLANELYPSETFFEIKDK